MGQFKQNMANEATAKAANGDNGRADNNSRRLRTKTLNRAAILAGARLVFAELGYDGTSVRDIIRRTNLASGTFYNYFKSKEEVFQAIHDDSVQKFRPFLRQARIEAGDDLAAYMRLACTFYFQFLLASRPLAPELANDPSITKVRVSTPESVALFAELKADLGFYAQKGDWPSASLDIVAAACFGTAEEVGALVLAGVITDAEQAAIDCAKLMMGGINAL